MQSMRPFPGPVCASVFVVISLGFTGSVSAVDVEF